MSGTLQFWDRSNVGTAPSAVGQRALLHLTRVTLWVLTVIACSVNSISLVCQVGPGAGTYNIGRQLCSLSPPYLRLDIKIYRCQGGERDTSI